MRKRELAKLTVQSKVKQILSLHSCRKAPIKLEEFYVLSVVVMAKKCKEKKCEVCFGEVFYA